MNYLFGIPIHNTRLYTDYINGEISAKEVLEIVARSLGYFDRDWETLSK